MRIWLTSAAMATAILAGGAATTTQAALASASSETATASCTAMGFPPVYTCKTQQECRETAENLGYEDWICTRLPNGWWELHGWT